MEVFAVNPMPSVFSLAASAFEEKKKKNINAGEASLRSTSADAPSLLSFALAGYRLGNA